MSDDVVPFLDFHAALTQERAELQRAFDEVLDSGWLVLGPQLEAFEREFAAFCGVAHAVGVGTGLDAITLALRALGVGAGDEVIVPAHTYIASWLGIEQAGATLVPVDADPTSGLLDVEAVRAAVTDRTRAIMPVHLYGHPEDMATMRALADECGALLVDDAAQAHGAMVGHVRVGSLADATAFSFYPGKNLGALGDGGAVTTGSEQVREQLHLLRNYGSPRKYQNDVIGTNSRLDELHAAFLRTRLVRIDAHNARRREVAARYAAALDGTDIHLAQPHAGATSSWHLAVVWLEQRDALAEHLAADGIATLIHYPTPPHLSGAFASRSFGPFPVAERIARQSLSLPIGPYITDEQVERVIASLRAFAERAA